MQFEEPPLLVSEPIQHICNFISYFGHIKHFTLISLIFIIQTLQKYSFFKSTNYGVGDVTTMVGITFFS